MLKNPFLPAPSKAAAWAEGFTKGFLALSSPEPGENVALDDVDAFNLGGAAGSQSAIEGVSPDDPCLPALEAHGPAHIPMLGVDAAHIGLGLWELRHINTAAGGVAGMLVGLLSLAVSLPVHTLPPEDLVPTLAEPLIEALTAYGLESVELFCGAGLDALASDCEIRVTPLFATLSQARDAVIAMERAQWIVLSWRTDQTNSLRVVDAA